MYNCLRECAAEQRTSSWLRARVAKGLRAAPLRQFRRAKQSKAEQSGRIPGSSVSIGMSCRNFACWLPKIGLLLGIFHAPRTENAPHGYERFGAPSENPPYGYARKKKKPSTDDGQLFTQVALRSNVFHRAFFATGPPLRLRSRPPDSGFAGVLPRHCRHVIHAHLLGFGKLRNFLRPINASMKEEEEEEEEEAEEEEEEEEEEDDQDREKHERNYICTVHTPDRPPPAAN